MEIKWPKKYETGIPDVAGRSPTPITPYRAVRRYANRPDLNETLFMGVHQSEARAHCERDEAFSETCDTEHGRRLTRERGPWRDYAEPME